MKSKAPLHSLLLYSSLLSVTSLQAATFYWDTNGATVGFGASANGGWAQNSTTTGRWTTDAEGDVAGSLTQVTASSDTFNFGSATHTLGAGTITINAAGVTMGTTNFNATSGAIVLTGGTITYSAAPVITVNNATNTISSIIGGAATSITKNGAGTLLLNGSAANTFTGGLILNAGTVALDFANMATPTNLLASGKALTFSNGASFTLKGKSSGATAQTMGNVTVNAGGGILLIDPNGGTSTTLTLGTLNPTAVGSSLAIGKALGAGSGTLTITSTTNKNAQDIYGGRIVFADGTANTGYDWATTASVATPYTLSAYSGYTAMATSGTDTLNSRITASETLTGALTTNTLKIENPAASQVLDLGANLLTLTGSGLLVTGTNSTSITGTAGATRLTGSASGDLVVHQYNSGGLEIGAVIGNNVGATALTKAGTGALTLSAVNTFTGGLFVNAGEVVIGNAGALISTAGSENAVTLGTGTLSLNGNSVVVRSLTSSNPASVVRNANLGPVTLTVGNSGNAASIYAGSIQDGPGGGALTLAKSGTGTLNLSNGTSTFSGGIVMNAGMLTFNSDTNLGALGASNGITFNSSASLSPGNTVFARNIAINGSSVVATFDGGGSTNTGNLTGTGGIAISNAFGSQHTFSGTANTFQGSINIGLVSGTTGQAYRATFASLADSASANGRIIFKASSVTHANGSVFEYTGGTNLVLGNRQFEIASTGATPTNGHQIRSSGAGTITVNTDLIVTSTTAQTLTLTGTNTGANAFTTDISNGSSSALSLTKSAAGSWTLSGNNSYTGTTRISGGFTSTLKADHASALGVGGDITYNGNGVLEYTANSAGTDWSTRFKNSTFAIGISSGGQAVTYAGVIDSTNTNGFIKYGSGSVTLSNANSFTGTTTIDQGALVLGTNAPVSAAGALGNSNTEVALGTASSGSFAQLHTNGAFTVDRAIRLRTSDTTDAGTRVLTIGGTTAADSVFSGNIFLGTANQTSKGIQLTAAASGKVTFSGVIQNPTGQDATEALAAASLTAVTKTGLGTVVLSNTNTYTGTTAVNQGTLLVNGSTVAASAVTVASTATLGGTGAIGGTVTVSGGATLAPGASIQSLAAGSLSMATTSTFAYEVADNTATGADLLAVGGTISLTGVTLSLDAASIAALSGGAWSLGDKLTLISYLDAGSGITSGFTGYDDNTPYFFGANKWFFDYNDTLAGDNFATDATAASQNHFVTMTVIPEPRAALLGGLGLLALLRRRR